MKGKLIKVLAIALSATLAFSMTACSKTEETSDKKLKVGIVLSTGGRGDKSFNDAAIRGLDNAVKDFGIEYKDSQPKDVADDEKALDTFASQGYDLVIGVGFMMGDALKAVAEKYPNTKFGIIDYTYDPVPANIVCLTFAEHEGSFLAGVLAAGMSKTGTVGFVGGMESPLINRFDGGFTAGAKAQNPDITVISKYVGTGGDAFNNPVLAKEIALDQISKGADVIYHASGGSGQGVFDAAAEKGIFAIGVDSNQNWIKPGAILASMLKAVDVAVYDTVKSVKESTFAGGKIDNFNLARNGVGLTDLTKLTVEETDGVTADDQKKMTDMKALIPAELKTSIEDFSKKIKDGSIVVPDWSVDKPQS